jgi:hypothetical protein
MAFPQNSVFHEDKRLLKKLSNCNVIQKALRFRLIRIIISHNETISSSNVENVNKDTDINVEISSKSVIELEKYCLLPKYFLTDS